MSIDSRIRVSTNYQGHGRLMVSWNDNGWFIGGFSRFLRLHGWFKVAFNKYYQLEMVAMEYFWVHFATDKLDIAISM